MTLLDASLNASPDGVAISDCLEQISDPNAFYLVLVAAHVAREEGLTPLAALKRVAQGNEIPAVEERFLRSLMPVMRPVREVLGDTALRGGKERRQAEEEIDQFGQDMDELALIQAMEGHAAANASNMRFSRSRLSPTGDDDEPDEEPGAQQDDQDESGERGHNF